MPCVPSCVHGAEQPAAVCAAGGSKPSKAKLRCLKQKEKSTDQYVSGNSSFACNAKTVADKSQPMTLISDGVDTVFGVYGPRLSIDFGVGVVREGSILRLKSFRVAVLLDGVTKVCVVGDFSVVIE